MAWLRSFPFGRFVSGCVLSIFLSSCCTFGTGGSATHTLSLSDVVEVVQFAVDAASADKIWQATKADEEHWSAACKAAKAQAGISCGAMVLEADSLCKARCANGQCNPVQQQICMDLIAGNNLPLYCKLDASFGSWCNAAGKCGASKQAATDVCKRGDTVTMPVLKHAVLNVGVERSNTAAAGMGIMVVSFGSSSSRVASNSVEIILTPRANEKSYSQGLPSEIVSRLPKMTPRQDAMSVSAAAISGDLKDAILSAVAASVRETAKGKTPPMMASQLEVVFSLTIEAGGKLGLKKEWSGPFSLELGGASGTKRTNTLKIVYARPE